MAHQIWSTLERFHEGNGNEKTGLFETYQRVLGVFFSAKGPQDKGITGKVMLRILFTKGPRDEDTI
jgi:hypothetical protein